MIFKLYNSEVLLDYVIEKIFLTFILSIQKRINENLYIFGVYDKNKEMEKEMPLPF